IHIPVFHTGLSVFDFKCYPIVTQCCISIPPEFCKSYVNVVPQLPDIREMRLLPPNPSRVRVKTQTWSFWKTKKWFKSLSPKIKTRHNQNVNANFSAPLARGEFSHRLAIC